METASNFSNYSDYLSDCNTIWNINAKQSHEDAFKANAILLVEIIKNTQVVSDVDLAKFLIDHRLNEANESSSEYAANEFVENAFKIRNCDSMSSFIEKINREINVNTLKIKDVETIKEIYGGASGNVFFQEYKNNVVFPYALKFLSNIVGQPLSEEKQTAAFKEFILTLGEHRNHIAVQTNTRISHQFGQPSPSGGMLTDIIERTLPWKRYVKEKYKEELGNFDLLSIKAQGEDANNFGSIEDNEFSGLTFYHKRLEPNDYKRVSEFFIGALNAEVDLENLQENLGKLLLAMSHATFFKRGQAAITEWVLQSLANINGYQLSYSKEWRGGEYPQPDQYALSYFDVASFIEEFKKNSFFQPLEK